MVDEQPKRFFVTIVAPTEQLLRELFGRGLDLFATRSDESGHRVDGLITLEDVGQLVQAGYKVLVSESARPKREHRFIGAEEWMKNMLDEFERERRQR
jgi:hypothetical protein